MPCSAAVDLPIVDFNGVLVGPLYLLPGEGRELHPGGLPEGLLTATVFEGVETNEGTLNVIIAGMDVAVSAGCKFPYNVKVILNVTLLLIDLVYGCPFKVKKVFFVGLPGAE